MYSHNKVAFRGVRTSESTKRELRVKIVLEHNLLCFDHTLTLSSVFVYLKNNLKGIEVPNNIPIKRPRWFHVRVGWNKW